MVARILAHLRQPFSVRGIVALLSLALVGTVDDQTVTSVSGLILAALAAYDIKRDDQ